MAYDFGIGADDGVSSVALTGDQSLLLAGSLPDVKIVGRHVVHHASVHLGPRVRRDITRGKPQLIATTALLDAPPVFGRRRRFYSLTFNTAAFGAGEEWGSRILARQTALPTVLLERAAAFHRRVVDDHALGPWSTTETPSNCSDRIVIIATLSPNLTFFMLDYALARVEAGRLLLVAPAESAVTVTAAARGIQVVLGTPDPWLLTANAAAVHSAGDAPEGMIALLLGTPVQAHSAGPLALTSDPVRLTAAVLLLGARYADPFRGGPLTAEAFLDHARDWRRQRARMAGVAVCAGISFWKRRRIAEFAGGEPGPAFQNDAGRAVASALARKGGIAVWPSRAPKRLAEAADAAGVTVAQVEDGFIRSAGLGADFLPPLSIVLDRQGIYYDATRPSDLEILLASTCFSPALLERAAALRLRLVRQKVTKYNLKTGKAPVLPSGRCTILVPGQVSDDRSVQLGGAGRRPGVPLLRRVRERMPDAFIVYKPHPDVEAGHRPGAIPDSTALRWADLIVRDVDLTALLEHVDEVHTLTSLTGFEALLRGKPVTTYGQPFFAGWGLTTDDNAPARRGRVLKIDELVAGALILYPHYIDPVTLLPCDPEIVLDRLAQSPHRRPSALVSARRMHGRLMRTVRGLRVRFQSQPLEEDEAP